MQKFSAEIWVGSGVGWKKFAFRFAHRARVRRMTESAPPAGLKWQGMAARPLGGCQGGASGEAGGGDEDSILKGSLFRFFRFFFSAFFRTPRKLLFWAILVIWGSPRVDFLVILATFGSHLGSLLGVFSHPLPESIFYPFFDKKTKNEKTEKGTKHCKIQCFVRFSRLHKKREASKTKHRKTLILHENRPKIYQKIVKNDICHKTQ